MDGFWILYDLVIVSIAVLCIWNGATEGLYKALSGIVVTAVSIAAAFLLSGPAASAVYDVFLRDTCQSFVEEKLEEADVAANVRGYLEQKGVCLPYSNEEMAEFIEEVQSNGSISEQAAALVGIDAATLEKNIGKALDYAVESHSEVIPQWAADSLKSREGGIDLDNAAETAAALLKNDASEAAQGIQEGYIKPAVMPLLKGVMFTLLSILLPIVLRMVLKMFPEGKSSLTGTALGGAVGALKACIYIFLAVQLTACISAAENGSYPLYSRETINQTYIFRIFYDMFADIL